tara:strand:+ start:583 stop:768 length:186 start_codon:yes stop_codon:yes gene_type:complete
MKYRNFYTLRETAGMLRVSEETIYRMARRGDIDGTKVGQQWRFSEESIKNLNNRSGKKNQH